MAPTTDDVVLDFYPVAGIPLGRQTTLTGLLTAAQQLYGRGVLRLQAVTFDPSTIAVPAPDALYLIHPAASQNPGHLAAFTSADSQWHISTYPIGDAIVTLAGDDGVHEPGMRYALLDGLFWPLDPGIPRHVVDIGAIHPPASPIVGGLYILGDSAARTGAWGGTGSINRALWNGTSWVFYGGDLGDLNGGCLLRVDAADNPTVAAPGLYWWRGGAFVPRLIKSDALPGDIDLTIHNMIPDVSGVTAPGLWVVGPDDGIPTLYLAVPGGNPIRLGQLCGIQIADVAGLSDALAAAGGPQRTYARNVNLVQANSFVDFDATITVPDGKKCIFTNLYSWVQSGGTVQFLNGDALYIVSAGLTVLAGHTQPTQLQHIWQTIIRALTNVDGPIESGVTPRIEIDGADSGADAAGLATFMLEYIFVDA
jgi:hypothetical protein